MSDEKERSERAMGEPATAHEQETQRDDEVAMGQAASSAETAAQAEDQIAMGQLATAAQEVASGRRDRARRAGEQCRNGRARRGRHRNGQAGNATTAGGKGARGKGDRKAEFITPLCHRKRAALPPLLRSTCCGSLNPDASRIHLGHERPPHPQREAHERIAVRLRSRPGLHLRPGDILELLRCHPPAGTPSSPPSHHLPRQSFHLAPVGRSPLIVPYRAAGQPVRRRPPAVSTKYKRNSPGARPGGRCTWP
jgi:hypothetical protein